MYGLSPAVPFRLIVWTTKPWSLHMQFPISGEYCAHHLVNEPTSTDAGAYFDLDTCCDEYRVLREKKSQVIYIRKGLCLLVGYIGGG